MDFVLSHNLHILNPLVLLGWPTLTSVQSDIYYIFHHKGEFTKAKASKSQHEETLHPNTNPSKAQSLALVKVLIPASKVEER